MYYHWNYLACFIVPVTTILFLSTAPHDAITVLLWTLPLWGLILLDWLSPKVNPTVQRQALHAVFYDAILYALALLQCLIIVLLLIVASRLQWSSGQEMVTSSLNLLVMRILVGTSSGSSALIVAHELIHRPKRHLRRLGHLLLYTVCYEHFVIAHLRGHHYHVATSADVVTARLGERFSDYWHRVYLGHFQYAWHSEQQRLALSDSPWYDYKILQNSVLQGILVEIMLLFLIFSVFGWVAVFIFLYQAFAGIRLLESINYYQHWGLEQGKAHNMLAWVNQSLVTEYALLGLSRHIGHHNNPATAFYATPYSVQGPVMPYGYFVTNLWVKLDNASYRRVAAGILKNVQ